MPRIRNDNRMRVTFWRMRGPTSIGTTQVVTQSLTAALTIANMCALNRPMEVGHVVLVEVRGYSACNELSLDCTGLNTRYVFDRENRRWVHSVNMTPSRDLLVRYGYYIKP